MPTWGLVVLEITLELIQIASVRISALWGASLLLCLSAQAGAHVGDRVYPIHYLSDEILQEIRLDDGLVDEWSEVIGEPSLITSDFTEKFRNAPFDPSDLDFRVWLAWHDDPARIYLAFVSSDDAYQNTHDYNVDWNKSFQDDIHTHDSIMLTVDGDHSGGEGLTSDWTEEESVRLNGNLQSYEAIAGTPSGPNIDGGGRYTGAFGWTSLPPYGDGGGGVFGEAPVISTIELYVTPFDAWEGWDSPGQMEVSKLAAEQVIGFGIVVYDYDPSERWTRWTPGQLLYRALGRGEADALLDGVLLAPDPSAPPGDSAVKSVSWARIKASLEVE